MTDLERVREALSLLHEQNPPVIHVKFQQALADIDAHLKEDEEREEDYTSTVDELARLRSENQHLVSRFRAALDERDRLRHALSAADNEKARLRYELSVADYPGKQTLVEELARLREGIRAILDDEMRDCYDCESDLRQLIEENDG